MKDLTLHKFVVSWFGKTPSSVCRFPDGARKSGLDENKLIKCCFFVLFFRVWFTAYYFTCTPSRRVWRWPFSHSSYRSWWPAYFSPFTVWRWSPRVSMSLRQVCFLMNRPSVVLGPVSFGRDEYSKAMVRGRTLFSPDFRVDLLTGRCQYSRDSFEKSNWKMFSRRDYFKSNSPIIPVTIRDSFEISRYDDLSFFLHVCNWPREFCEHPSLRTSS